MRKTERFVTRRNQSAEQNETPSFDSERRSFGLLRPRLLAAPDFQTITGSVPRYHRVNPSYRGETPPLPVGYHC